MGNEDIISLLEETLSEKKEALELLTALAEGGIIVSAATGAPEKQLREPEKIEAKYDSVNLTGKSKE